MMGNNINVNLNPSDTEIVLLDCGIQLHIVKKLNKPVLVTAADGKNWIDEVVEVVHFYRPWISRILGTRRCDGTLKVRPQNNPHGNPRLMYFKNAHPIWGYRLVWDKEENLFNTPFDKASLLEKLNWRY